MLKHGKTAMIVAITLGVLGSASAALAGAKDDDGGAGAGGYVVPGSSVGVNPVYHPELFAQQQSANTAFAQAQESKKAPKDKKASAKSSSNSSKESDEEARLRRFYDNR
jgi:hypothetical protein